MKKKFAILLTIALLCVLGVTAVLARGTIAGFFAQETTTAFYEPFSQGTGTTAAGWDPPSYAIYGVEMRVEQYFQDTKELLVAITNSSDRELLWAGNQTTDFQLLYWDGGKWDFVQLEEGYEPHPHPYNTGELPPGQEAAVSYALEDYPLLREGMRYRIEIWIREAEPPEDGHVGAYQINAEFAV